MNSREPEPVALFDLDGTLADFDGAMVAAMNQLAGPGEPPWESQPQGEEREPPFITAQGRDHLKFGPSIVRWMAIFAWIGPATPSCCMVSTGYQEIGKPWNS